MVRRTGQQGVPVVAIDDQYIVGFDQQRIEQAIRGATGSRPTFGASVANVSSAPVGTPGLPPSGAYVGRVKAGSAASRAGLAVGDVIVELAGKPVSTADELQAALKSMTLGATIDVTYVRSGERHTAEVQL